MNGITSFGGPSRYLQGWDSKELLNVELLRKLKASKIDIMVSMTGIAESLNYFEDIRKEFHLNHVQIEDHFCIIRSKNNRRADLVIGFGGGRILDLAKRRACELDTKLILVPKFLSSNAACTSVAVLPKDERQGHMLFQAKYADYVIADLELLKETPMNLLRAGCADALSSAVEAIGAYESGDLNLNKHFSLSLVVTLAEGIKKFFQELELVLEFDPLILAGSENSKEYEELVEVILLSSALVAESGGVSFAHEFATGVDNLSSNTVPHGLKVAVGLYKMREFSEVKDLDLERFFKRFGLPTTLGELGISLSDEDTKVLNEMYQDEINLRN